MPPFGKEPAEVGSKRTPFLKQHLHTPAPKSRLPAAAFQPEPAEEEVCSTPGRRPSNPLSSSSFNPFGAEPEEGHRKRPRPVATSTPFGAEADEGDGDSDLSSEFNEPPEPETVFAMGWQGLQRFVAGSFWKQHSNEGEDLKKPKRAYDNARRQADAAYKRKSTAGFFKNNGVDPERLQKLFNAPMCGCALFCFFHFRVFAEAP